VAWLRRHYGAGPLHLLGLLACFSVSAYAVTRVLGQSGWLGVLLWFVACVVLHDFVGWPVYTAADRLLVRSARRACPRGDQPPPPAPGPGLEGDVGSPQRVPWANHVRFPAVISGVLLGMFFPLIFRISNAYYQATTGFSENAYLGNWLVVTGILFGASALCYLVRLGWARRRDNAREAPL